MGKYRQSRNLVNKLKKQSIKKYFQDRCIGGCKSSNFWNTIKPYLSKKSRNSQNKIILNENDKVVSNNEEVADVFNDYFGNVADGIGKDYVLTLQTTQVLK